MLVNRSHGALSPGWFSGTAQNSPRLNDGVNAALLILGRAERRAIVEIGTAIPLSVPTFALERGLQRADVKPPSFSALAVAARIRDFGEFPEDGVQEPSQPNTLA